MSCVELYPEVFYFHEEINKVEVLENKELGSLSVLDDLNSVCPRGCVLIE